MYKEHKINIPDKAIDYIIREYLQQKHVEGVSITVGVSQKTVETIVQLFLDWHAKNGYIKDGVLIIGDED